MNDYTQNIDKARSAIRAAQELLQPLLASSRGAEQANAHMTVAAIALTPIRKPASASRLHFVAEQQQLFAVIKKNSKYYGQTDPGERFPIYIDPADRGDYKVKGGPGGQYRLADVQLYIITDGRELRIA